MIRKAEINDAEKISAIGKKTFFEAHELSSPKEELDTYLNQKFNVETVLIELGDSTNLFHLCYEDDKLAGYSKIVYNCPAAQIPYITDACKLERLYFLQSYYGKNLGIKLFNFNKNLCLQNNQSGMWLTVWTENERAIRFYEKLGFKTIGEIMFKVGNIYNPNFVMWLEL